MSDEIKIPVKYLALVVIIIAVMGLYFFGSKITGFSIRGVSEDEAKGNLMSFFSQEIPDSEIVVLSSSKQGDFYRFVVTIDGESVPFYVTGDGRYMALDLIPLK